MNIRQKVNFRNQLLLVILKAVGFIMLGTLGMFYFSRSIEKGVLGIIEKKGRIFLQSGQIENRARMKSDYEKLEKYFPALEKALPSRDELIILPSRLEKESLLIGASQTFVFGQEVEATETEPRGIIFSLTLVATKEQFLEYLKRVNNMPYFLAFTQLDMISDQGYQNTSKFLIKGKVYIKTDQ